MHLEGAAVLAFAYASALALSGCDRPRGSSPPDQNATLLLAQRSAERQQAESLRQRQEGLLQALRRRDSRAIGEYAEVGFVVDAARRSDARPPTARWDAPQTDFFRVISGTAGLPPLGASLRLDVLMPAAGAGIVLSRTAELCIVTTWRSRPVGWTAQRMAILPRPAACDTVRASILASLARRRR